MATSDEPGFIPPHGNYQELLSYQKAEVGNVEHVAELRERGLGVPKERADFRGAVPDGDAEWLRVVPVGSLGRGDAHLVTCQVALCTVEQACFIVVPPPFGFVCLLIER